jgi:hypothetical protein
VRKVALAELEGLKPSRAVFEQRGRLFLASRQPEAKARALRFRWLGRPDASEGLRECEDEMQSLRARLEGGSADADSPRV